MLSSFGKANLEAIKQALNIVWEQNALVINEKVINRPFDMFEMDVKIYNKHNILISYDRSVIDISIKKDGEYKWLTDLTDQEIVEGFDSCILENLVHNFMILDKVLQSI